MIDQDKIDAVAAALIESFKAVVITDSITGAKIELARTAMPHKDIWNRYAEVAIKAYIEVCKK